MFSITFALCLCITIIMQSSAAIRPDRVSPTPCIYDTKVQVTSDSPIPLWYCDESGCAKIPCTRSSSYGISFGILDGRYPADAEVEIEVTTVDITEELTWGFNWGGYKGNVTANWGLGKVHVKLDKYPPLEKQCAVKFTPSGYIADIKEWTRMETPCTYDCFAKKTSSGVYECTTTTGIQKYPEWLCPHGKLVIALKAGVWTMDTEKSSDCLVDLFTSVSTATGITLTIFNPWGYDVDENGTIEKSEVIAAIQDYFDNQITKEQLIKVIQLYFR